MRSRRARILGCLVLGAGTFFSLRPVEELRRGIDRLCSPARFLAELASPIALLRMPEARAAERRLLDAASEGARENLALIADLERMAEPREEGLRAGRRLLAAEVLGRAAGRRDRLVVLVRDARGVVPGLPVVSGDAYVGRVASVGAQGPDGRVPAEVELVTGRGFRVGARIHEGPGGEPVHFAVGEIDAGPPRGQGAPVEGGFGHGGTDRELRLAVHNPSDRELAGGLARVHELFSETDPHAALARGFRLGRVLHGADRSGLQSWSITPELDYVDGLFHVVLLAPERPFEPRVAPRPVLMDGRWVRTSVLGVGDPSPWREAVKVRAGERRGVRPGAAVVAVGARLVGRVIRSGAWSADVACLGDPGFSVVCAARVEGVAEPLILGRLVSLGRDEETREVLLRWAPRVAHEVGSGRELRAAKLYTGSGDPGLASGFFLGEALIPLDAQPGEAREIRLSGALEPRELATLYVRTAAAVTSVPGGLP